MNISILLKDNTFMIVQKQNISISSKKSMVKMVE